MCLVCPFQSLCALLPQKYWTISINRSMFPRGQAAQADSHALVIYAASMCVICKSESCAILQSLQSPLTNTSTLSTFTCSIWPFLPARTPSSCFSSAHFFTALGKHSGHLLVQLSWISMVHLWDFRSFCATVLVPTLEWDQRSWRPSQPPPAAAAPTHNTHYYQDSCQGLSSAWKEHAKCKVLINTDVFYT